MIDNFALGLSHGLLILAAWRLLFRADLDDDASPEPAATEKDGGRIADTLRKVRNGA